ncbi:NAD(P)H-dependent oxidoreductase [Kineosporia mesophila]|uniref:NAD(P)H-dependent oxidoreductase n=1 Tax=Kineosporia mesophila TaxID=566012 RepID=A0ABP6Z8T0_9ACTN|nr:NAD(P)H-dependent oxidoreductase [Kineosporia mesophila]MCD5352562.1 NAD(P)H-dependent oxidoreductase [Kineosporia mesophila]
MERCDLCDWPLPFFAEHFGTVGDPADPTYSEPLVRAWNQKVKGADAFLVVTPEYNHSIPAVLKNAIDSVWLSFGFRNKPVAALGYSAGIGGGIRSVEHLAQMFVEAEAVPLRNATIIPFANDAFDEQGQPVDPLTTASLTITLEDLLWWTSVLEKARAEGELTPGRFRLRAAQEAARP